MPNHRRFLLTTGAFLAAILPGAARAGGPAVSAPNGDISLLGGSLSGDGAFGATGSFSVPLNQNWGAQFDGLIGSSHGTFYGFGGHVFWRDPSVGLVGVYGSYAGWNASKTVDVSVPDGGVANVDGANVGKIGLEGEAYLGRFSLEGLLAYQFGTFQGGAGKATVAFYPTDNLRLDLSYRYLQGTGSIGTLGGEWAPDPRRSGMSLFANASFGSGDTWSAFAGVRFHFGGEGKSLIQRHREDDPGNDLPVDLFQAIGDHYCPVGTREFEGFCNGVI